MILLDTNVLIYASTDRSPFLEWTRCTIAAARADYEVRYGKKED